MKDYGKEVIIDIHNCLLEKFTRERIEEYFIKLCKIIDMKREKLVWWDDLYTLKAEKETDPKLVGTSAIQFIKTSNITIHTLDIMKRVYINIFSCKDFNERMAKDFSAIMFLGDVVNFKVIRRK